MSNTLTLVGRAVGPYTVLRKLGEGGMGSVYEALNKATGRHVAIKFLHDTYAFDEEVLGRFFNEAIASSALDHPGMVQIFEGGMLDQETPYLIMEYLRGCSLEQRLASPEGRDGLPLRDALNVAWQTAAVLAELTSRGIVHRDLKPGNLMLVSDAVAAQGVRVKILDLGMAKLNRDLYERAVHTRCGTVMGTPLYMSPEQCCDSSEVDGKSDVYSLGIVLFEMLSGQPPFNTVDTRSLLALHMFAPIPQLDKVRPNMPRGLAALVTAMLAKEATHRPTMDQVRDSLAALLPASAEAQLALPERLRLSTWSDGDSHSPTRRVDILASTMRREPAGDVAAKAKMPGSESLAKTMVMRLSGRDGTQTHLLKRADTLVTTHRKEVAPLLNQECEPRDLTVGFVRISRPVPSLHCPGVAPSPVLIWCLFFIASLVLCMWI